MVGQDGPSRSRNHFGVRMLWRLLKEYGEYDLAAKAVNVRVWVFGFGSLWETVKSPSAACKAK